MIVYFAYPYSDNPKKRFKQILRKVRTVCEKRPDIVPVIPHQYDEIFGFQRGYSMPFLMSWMLEIISRCDGFCYDPSNVSTGVLWELAFARWLKKPIFTHKELMNNEQD